MLGDKERRKRGRRKGIILQFLYKLQNCFAKRREEEEEEEEEKKEGARQKPRLQQVIYVAAHFACSKVFWAECAFFFSPK